MEAPLPENEAERLQALRRYLILDTPPERQLDDITLLAAYICETPTALISLIDAGRQWFKSKVGWADQETSREISFCAHAILDPGKELIVPDTSRDTRFADNPLVTADPPHIRFYAGVPLVTDDGHALGTLCVIDRVPRTLKPEQLAALRALRRSVVIELELRRGRAELQRTDALRESEERYRKLADSSPDAILIHSEERITYVNHAMVALMRARNASDLVGKSSAFMLAPEYVDLVRQRTRRLYAGETLSRMEQVYVRLDGTLVEVEIAAAPLVLDNKPAAHVTVRDITDRKRIETQLKLLLDFVPIAISYFDRGETVLAVNHGFEQFVEMPAAEIIGRPVREVIGDEAYAVARPYIERAYVGESVSYERRRVRKDGTPRDLTIQHVPYRDSAGRIVGAFGFTTDITGIKAAQRALEESEARFRSLTALASDWYWEQDETLRFTFRSGNIEKDRGLAPDDLLGKSRWDFPALNLTEQDWARHRAQLERREPFRDFEIQHIGPDGRVRWVSISGEPVFDAGGRFRGYRGVGRNITEARQVRERMERINVELEERVGERTRELRDALKELDSFSYSVSHDLRAPVGAVSGFAHLLREGEATRLSDDGKHLLGMIEENAGRMVSLIEGLLRLSHLGRSQIRRVPLSMNALARDALRLQKSAPGAEIRIESLPECDGDPVLIGQVWANLVGNAIKYSRTRDPARVDVGWDRERQAYFVRDNGVGFDMQHAGKLFSAFERLHGTSEFEGSGIGLAIVQRIVERHGGAIWAESAPDDGATFWFTVPRQPSNGLPASG